MIAFLLSKSIAVLLSVKRSFGVQTLGPIGLLHLEEPCSPSRLGIVCRYSPRAPSREFQQSAQLRKCRTPGEASSGMTPIVIEKGAV